jgi:GDSL-like lipase/acylhydrolase family protein
MNKYLVSTLLTVATLALLLTGCQVDTPDPVELAGSVPTPGPAVFANYVSVGNSLTAGFMDGGLVINGQMNSFPQLVSTAIGYTGQSFTQPYILFPGVGSSDVGDDYAAGVLYFDGSGIAVSGMTLKTEVPKLLLASAWPFPYNNLGVPGATLMDVSAALSSANSQSPGNSYFDFILRNSIFGGLSMLEQAVNIGPTLMTVWAGNNDILGGATSGQPVVGTNITPTAGFTVMYKGMLDGLINGTTALTGTAPVVVVANIPDIASIPYFIPKPVFDQVMFANGYPLASVPAEEADAVFVRFPALSLDFTTFAQLPAKWTLSVAEVAAVQTAVAEFNAVIAAEVAARDDVYLFDANAMMAGLDPATEAAHFMLLAPTMGIEAAAATTLFSLDGIHPNNRGYAKVAEGFIEVLKTELNMPTLAAIPPAALTWDPTYGMIPTSAKADAPLVSADAAKAMDAVFR